MCFDHDGDENDCFDHNAGGDMMMIKINIMLLMIMMIMLVVMLIMMMIIIRIMMISISHNILFNYTIHVSGKLQ